MSHGRDNKIVPVYRMFQFIWDSPCILGKPCPACELYREKVRDVDVYFGRFGQCICKRAFPAEAAFYITRRQGRMLVFALMAELVHSGNAIQLTFSKVPNLRDQSSRVDEKLVLEYLAGSERARDAIYEAWKNPPPAIAMPCPPLPVYPFV